MPINIYHSVPLMLILLYISCRIQISIKKVPIKFNGQEILYSEIFENPQLIIIAYVMFVIFKQDIKLEKKKKLALFSCLGIREQNFIPIGLSEVLKR